MSDDVGQLESDIRHRIERGFDRGLVKSEVSGLLERLAEEYDTDGGRE